MMRYIHRVSKHNRMKRGLAAAAAAFLIASVWSGPSGYAEPQAAAIEASVVVSEYRFDGYSPVPHSELAALLADNIGRPATLGIWKSRQMLLPATCALRGTLLP